MSTRVSFLSPIAVFFLLLCVSVSCGGDAPIETGSNVDPVRYAGRWYEIASFPMRAQKNCKCTYAEYKVMERGIMSVYNRCIDRTSKEVKYISGTAYAQDSTNSRFKVKFFRIIKAPYYILDLDMKGYDWALVGTPDREYLWILSRNTTLKTEIFDSLLQKAQTLGFDVSKLQRTIQDCPE